ncbi:nucleoside transporter [Salmonella enterica]|uniref:nucleoside transporter n=2 Tax=Enterobacteriaceae TaxID=543 RepID=UPI001257C89C|nr:nucleoside transporter [Enterobacter hormaechei]EEP0988718.1 nucleoside transporter [Salmonella enterica]EEP1049015.1 nucleoside transporter [Salmonella enterica]EEP1113488.1 nucleoside transporter [Salmonella enterica]VAE62601.1 negative regulator GrlR [Enterobacter hormaechei]
MKEGIYNVVFESNISSVGEGVIVVIGKNIYGGDMAFSCRGTLKPPVITLEINHFNLDIPSTLGIEGDYTLEMRYQKIREGEYKFSGGSKEYPDRRLTAYAIFTAPLLTDSKSLSEY